MKDDYLSQLDEQQRAAVEYIDGPELVIAGAGSGKTRVLTYKIVHLLTRGYRAAHILALTFTNKAAREMKERIDALAGEGTSSRLWMGTFHSIFSRILRQNADRIGYSPRYTIYDASDSRSLIKSIIHDMDLDEKIYKPATVQNAISWAKNALISPEAYAADTELMKSDQNSRRGRTVDIYRAYVSRCRLADAMDFDDLLYYTAVLFRDNPEILGHYREFFRYILVDEYQDTNFAQNVIVGQLARPGGNICVVGDDAQSIYSFRGANIRNILEMERSYPSLRIFKLEQNYRSTRNITGASNSLIAHNANRMPKDVFSRGDLGEPVEVQSGYSDYDEAGLVAARIVSRRVRTGDPLSEFAILYRTNAQSRVLEEALRRRNIAYRIYGGQAFYQRKEVKDAVCYFRLAVNPRDDEALRRVINVPARGIGKTTLDKLSAAAMAEEVSIWDVLTDTSSYQLDINSGTRGKLDRFVSLVGSFIEADRGGADAEAVARMIIRDTGLMAMYYTDSTPENVSKRENLQELLNGAHSFVEDRREEGADDRTGLADLLTDISLATDQDTEDGQGDAVTLMTIHASKGLEFANVFVVGVEEDLLPSQLSHDSAESIEEERRLFYVALTRAKSFCMLSYASSRYLNGQTMICRPSRFFGDIDTRFVRYSYGAERTPFIIPQRSPRPAVVAGTTPAHKSPVAPSRHPAGTGRSSVRNQTERDNGEFVKHTLADLSEGTVLYHPKFGRGTVVRLDDNSLGSMAIVRFDNDDERKLLLNYARFKILDR